MKLNGDKPVIEKPVAPSRFLSDAYSVGEFTQKYCYIHHNKY